VNIDEMTYGEKPWSSPESQNEPVSDVEVLLDLLEASPPDPSSQQQQEKQALKVSNTELYR
jgi:hypothetical protein